MTKRLSLVVTYDTDTGTLVVDNDVLSILFPEGSCWDVEGEGWLEEPDLLNDVTERLIARLSNVEQLSARQVSAPTKFIELALNIIDPDGAWDPEATLEFGDAARVYLSEYPLSSWEIEGAFNLAAQFVHDWALGKVRVVDGMSYEIDGTAPRAAFAPLPSTRVTERELDATSSDDCSSEFGSDGWQERTTLETHDPLSGTPLRMIWGEFEGVPTLALFVGEDEDPVLIDRSALQIAVDHGRETIINVKGPVLSFRSNADREFEGIHLDIDLGPDFE